MGLIRTVVYMGIIGGIFAYSQTKDSLDNLSLPDVELPAALTNSEVMNSTWVRDNVASLKSSELAQGMTEAINNSHDIRSVVNEAIMTAQSIDIQHLVESSVEELGKTSQKTSK